MTRRELMQYIVQLAGAHATLSAPLSSQVCKCAEHGPPAQTLVIRGATVIDHDGALRGDRDVIVKEGRLASMERTGSIAIPQDANVIQGNRRYVIPALWDMHVHLSYTKACALPLLLANGVMGVRDMGGLLAEIDSWRTQIDDELLQGPRILRAGPVLNGKAFAFQQFAVANAAEAQGAVRALQKAGVDFIKVHAAISRDAYFGVAHESKALGIPFVGHIPRALEPVECSDNGQASLEHLETLFDGKLLVEVLLDKLAPAVARYREQTAPSVFARFAVNGTYYTPTLTASSYVVLNQLATLANGTRVLDARDAFVSQFCKRVTDEILVKLKPDLEPDRLQLQHAPFEEYLKLVGLMHHSGVRLLAGTDFAYSVMYPGSGLHDELGLLVQAGLTPVEALRTATYNPALFFGEEEVGRLKIGSVANFILLDGDPLADIRNTRRIRAFVHRGSAWTSAQIGGLLDESKILALEA